MKKGEEVGIRMGLDVGYDPGRKQLGLGEL